MSPELTPPVPHPARAATSLRRNILWNLAGLGLPLVIGFFAVRYLLVHAGVEVLGILTLIWALIGYFSLFDLGLGRALTQQVAQSLAGDPARHARDLGGLVKSGLLSATGAGLIGAALLALLAHGMATRWLKVSLPLQGDVFGALLIAALGVPLTTATAALRGVLEAYEDFRAVSLLRLLLGAANFGLPVLTVMVWGPSLMAMVLSLMVARVLITWAHVVLVRRRIGGAVLSGAQLQRRHVHTLLAFGAWMTLSNVISPLMVTADRFFIAGTLSAAWVAYYALPSELVTRALILPGALTGVLFPRLASLLTHDIAAARSLYRRCMLVLTGLLLPICLAMAVGAHWGLTFWLGAEFASHAAPVLSVLALGLLFNGVAFVPFAAVQAAGHARITAQLHLIELVLYLPLLWWALNRFGLVGAAAVWTARVGLDLLLLLIAVQRYVLRPEAAVSDPAMQHNLPPAASERKPP